MSDGKLIEWDVPSPSAIEVKPHTQTAVSYLAQADPAYSARLLGEQPFYRVPSPMALELDLTIKAGSTDHRTLIRYKEYEKAEPLHRVEKHGLDDDELRLVDLVAARNIRAVLRLFKKSNFEYERGFSEGHQLAELEAYHDNNMRQGCYCHCKLFFDGKRHFWSQKYDEVRLEGNVC